MALRGLFRRVALPEELAASLDTGERILAAAAGDGGVLLAASRFGLWVVQDESATRTRWHLISKARLAGKVLTVVVADDVGRFDDGTVVLVDRVPTDFTMRERSGLTDVVHSRVRGSVAASRHLPWPRAGGWVVLRRTAGQDGLTRQVRLDPGADPAAPGFAEAVAAVAAGLEREHAGSPIG